MQLHDAENVIDHAHDQESTIFVIDGDASMHEPFHRVIRAAGYQARMFLSAEEFLAHPRGNDPCCVVLEVMLPKLSGLALQKRLAELKEVPFIFVSRHRHLTMAVQAMKGGAVEFLTKPVVAELLVQAMQTAIAQSRIALRLRAERRMLEGCSSSLTRREREVMALVVSGLLNKQVGHRLGISEITVKAHRGHVMRKMKAGSLPHLVTMAAQLGLHLGGTSAAA